MTVLGVFGARIQIPLRTVYAKNGHLGRSKVRVEK